MKVLKNLLVLLIIPILLLAMASATPANAGALASKPTKSEFTVDDGADIDDLCSYSIHLDSHMIITLTEFYDQGGLTKLFFHIVAQDTLSANGKEVVGIPYT